MKQIQKMKRQRRDNRKEGILNNESIEVKIRKLQEEVSQVIADMRQKELEVRINSIEQTREPVSNQIWKIRKAMKTKRSDEGHTVKRFSYRRMLIRAGNDQTKLCGILQNTTYSK